MMTPSRRQPRPLTPSCSPSNVQATVIRIYPTGFTGSAPSVRVKVYGCDVQLKHGSISQAPDPNRVCSADTGVR